MATLHIVNKFAALESCLEVAAESDTVLLIEDGVYAAVGADDERFIVLSEDVAARGLEDILSPEFSRTDYAGFVKLAVDHQPIVSWR